MKFRYLLLTLILANPVHESFAAGSTFEDVQSRLSSPDAATALEAARQMAFDQSWRESLRPAERQALTQLAIQHDSPEVRAVGYDATMGLLSEHFMRERSATTAREESAARDARRSVFEQFHAQMPTIKNDILTGGPVVAGIAAELVMLGDGGASFQQLVMQRAASSAESRIQVDERLQKAFDSLLEEK